MSHLDSDEGKARYYAIMDWYDLERTNKSADLVPIIKQKLADCNLDADRIALLQVLAWELNFKGQFADAADALLEWAALEPTEPLPFITLAGQRLYFEDNPQQALADIDRAITLAEACGRFRRHALNTRGASPGQTEGLWCARKMPDHHSRN